MKKILQFLGGIGTIVTIITGVLSLYFLFKKENPKLEVTTYSEQLITQQHDIENLQATYIYKDSLEVDNLWQVKYIIRNIGKSTIVGRGENSTLIDTGIGYSFSNDANVLYCDITNNVIDATLENDFIVFQQWKNDEFVEISALIESSECPQFKINHRDIIDADVKYSQFAIHGSNDKKLIRFVPQEYASRLRYIWLIYQLVFMGGFFSIIYTLVKIGVVSKKTLQYLNVFGVKLYFPYKIVLLLVCIILMLPILWFF